MALKEELIKLEKHLGYKPTEHFENSNKGFFNKIKSFLNKIF